jgi:hypothetical protein
VAREQARALAERRQRRREPRRAPVRARTVLIALLLIGLVGAAVAVFASGGGSSKSSTSGSGAEGAAAPTHASRHTHGSSKAAHAATNPALTSVSVLNGTETSGLAHRIATQLHRSGFAKASALSGRPPGANQTTVVEYASGHKRDAQAVARSLGVGHPQPVEATASSLAGAASVVVIVGLDKATTGP